MSDPVVLTDEQRLAVDCDHPMIVVQAAAGSGKTRVLVERVRRLLEKHEPSQLLVLTFTRKAANEMRKRLVGDDLSRLGDMFLGTFHSISLRFLRAHGHLLGYSRFTVIDEADGKMMLRESAKALRYLRGEKWSPGLSMERVTRFRDGIYSGHKTFEHPGDDDACATIVQHYLRELEMSSLMDFGSLLRNCLKLFGEHPSLLAEYQARFRHVLVDELQDADTTQYSLHDLFSPPAWFFGVGDIRQTIYGFRGARPDLMARRESHATVLPLTLNFRSCPAVVSYANDLLAASETRAGEVMVAPPRPMVSAIPEIEGAVLILNGRTDAVVMAVREGIASGWKPGEIAVVARRHSDLARIEGRFGEDAPEVPIRRVGRGADVLDGDCRIALYCMRLAVNHSDACALRGCKEVLGIDKRGQINDVLLDAKTNAMEPLDWVRGIAPFGTKWAERCDTLCKSKPEDSAMAFLDALGFSRTYSILLDLGASIGMVGTDPSIATIVDLIGTFDHDAENAESTDQAVTLLTAHACKGLEWKLVIVVELHEGDFPTARAIKECHVAEERLLMYVAATRAKHVLVLHCRQEADFNGKPLPASRFLRDVIQF